MATISALAQRSKSISSTFSSMSEMRCGSGVSAAMSGKAATGMLARLPSNGSECASPQKEISNFGLMRTMSAMCCLRAPLARTVSNFGSPEQRVEVEQLLVLIERIAIGHAGDEVTDLARKSASVVGKRILAPIGRHQLRLVHIGVEKIADDALSTLHDGKHTLVAIHAMREKSLQDAVLLPHLGAEGHHRRAQLADFLDRCGLEGAKLPATFGQHVADHRRNQPAHRLMDDARALEPRIGLEDLGQGRADKGVIAKIDNIEQAGPEPIIDVMRVIGDVIS